MSFTSPMDSQGRLLLNFNDYGDGIGKLFAQVTANGFSGEGEAWFSKTELQDFADAIAVFPIPEGKSPEIISSPFKRDRSDGFEQEHLALKVYPIDHVGHLGLQVRIASELYMHERPESQRTVKLEIVTSYEPLARFSRNLKALVDGRVEEVILNGDISR